MTKPEVASKRGSRVAARGKKKQGAADVLRVVQGKPDKNIETHDLDRLIHERMRLGIMSALAVNKKLTFAELKVLMRTTDGNLSVHARKLEDADYIACAKFFEARMPRTEYRITARGNRALNRYLDHMDALIRATRRP